MVLRNVSPLIIPWKRHQPPFTHQGFPSTPLSHRHFPYMCSRPESVPNTIIRPRLPAMRRSSAQLSLRERTYRFRCQTQVPVWMKNVTDSDMTEIDFAYQLPDTSSFDTERLIQFHTSIPIGKKWGLGTKNRHRFLHGSLNAPSRCRPYFLIISRTW